MLFTISKMFRRAEESEQVRATLSKQETNEADSPCNVHEYPDDQKFSQDLCSAENIPIEHAHGQLNETHGSNPKDQIGQLYLER
jgi:hypothetical protein